LRRGGTVPMCPRPQRLAVDELHRDVDVLPRLAAPEKANDAGMIELRHGGRFAPETADVVGYGRHLRREDLHGDQESVGVAAAAKHLPHAALADPLEHDEPLESRQRRLRLDGGPGRFRGRLLARRRDAPFPMDLESNAAMPAARERSFDEQADVAADI